MLVLQAMKQSVQGRDACLVQQFQLQGRSTSKPRQKNRQEAESSLHYPGLKQPTMINYVLRWKNHKIIKKCFYKRHFFPQILRNYHKHTAISNPYCLCVLKSVAETLASPNVIK